MKKISFAMLVFAVIMFSSFAAFAIDGDGTEESPFIITDQWELELVTDFPNCHFKLANDIELEGTWIPLCKQTSSGNFNGVFDGCGYTISNLSVEDGTYGGLFNRNGGVIKNVVVKGNISGSYSYVGDICGYNYGTISQCNFEGNIENTNSSGYTGGICGYNSSSIVEQCGVIGNITGEGYTGGIGGYNSSSKIEQCSVIGNITGKGYTGGICGENYGASYSADISDCYFIGEIISSSSYKGGISGRSSGYSKYTTYYANVDRCYSVSIFNDGGYGITGYPDSSAYLNVKKSYYDKTISGLTSTSYGTPKSTVAMKMKQTYESDWDFDTVWGINKNINNGYPYLLWEYADVESENHYTINNMKITNSYGEEYTQIPDNGFYVEVSVTKNDNLKNADSIIIATYDENGSFIDMKFMKGSFYQNQTVEFGTNINNSDKKIASIKCFVWDSMSSMIPLSNVVVYYPTTSNTGATIGASTYTYLINSVTPATFEDSPATKVTYYRAGSSEIETKYIEDDYVASEFGYDPEELKSGDIVKMTLSGNYITNIKPVYIDGELLATTGTSGAYEIDGHYIKSDYSGTKDYYQVMLGVVYQREGTSLRVVPAFMEDNEDFNPDAWEGLTLSDSVQYYKYNTKKNTFEITSDGEIMAYSDMHESAVEDSTKILAIGREKKIVAVLIIE